MSAQARQLKIKTGAVKRLIKDKQCYLMEAESQRKRIAEYEARNAHEADVRKQQEVLAETLAMVPDTERRIRVAMQDLENLLAVADDGEAVEEARAAVDLAKAALAQQ